MKPIPKSIDPAQADQAMKTMQIMDSLTDGMLSALELGQSSRVPRAIQMAQELVNSADTEFSIPRVDDGEPVFVLVGRDPTFSALCQAWAYMRSGQMALAQQSLTQALGAATIVEPLSSGHPQITSAFRLSLEGTEYRTAQALKRAS